MEESIAKIRVVTPGDDLGTTEHLVASSGTYEQKGVIYSAMAGIVQRIGKLVMVKPLKRKYIPDQGQIVVGRIISVDNDRWKVDINSYQHASLLLTTINLPGNEQRRRSDDDKVIMREYFKENDIISAEVQTIAKHDGSIKLQTRNMKYGKLLNGFYLKVNHNLIKRMKNHYLNVLDNITVILGNNGYIWIYYNPISMQKEKTQKEIDMIETLNRGEQHEDNLQTAVKIPQDVLKDMARVRNCIVVLDKLGLPIFDVSIKEALSMTKEVDSPFEIWTNQEIIDKIGEVVKEYINENYLKDITQLIDSGIMDADQDFS